MVTTLVGIYEYMSTYVYMYVCSLRTHLYKQDVTQGHFFNGA